MQKFSLDFWSQFTNRSKNLTYPRFFSYQSDPRQGTEADCGADPRAGQGCFVAQTYLSMESKAVKCLAAAKYPAVIGIDPAVAVP